MITNDEFRKLAKLMGAVIEEKVPEIVRGIVKEEVGYLPTKEEFFDRMDALAGNLEKNSEAQDMITGRHKIHTTQLENHGKRIKKIEKTLNLS